MLRPGRTAVAHHSSKDFILCLNSSDQPVLYLSRVAKGHHHYLELAGLRLIIRFIPLIIHALDLCVHIEVIITLVLLLPLFLDLCAWLGTFQAPSQRI